MPDTGIELTRRQFSCLSGNSEYPALLRCYASELMKDQRRDSIPPVAIAVLAAGESRRFGANKLLAPWRGRPLLQHVLEQAQQACPGSVLLVTGHEAEELEAAVPARADLIVRNLDYAFGMGTSIAAAARACPADAIVIALGDQPLVTATHYRALISAWDRTDSGIVATAYDEIFGPPVLFGRRYLPTLTELRDDSGAKRILTEHRDRVITVDFPQASIDIDTPDDLEALCQAASSEQTYS